MTTPAGSLLDAVRSPLSRRRVALAALVIATVIAALAPHLGWRLPKLPETAMLAGAMLLAAVLAVRLVVASARARVARLDRHQRAEAARVFRAQLAWVDSFQDAETPEVQALRDALTRRHDQLVAATSAEVSRAVALQREALVEAVRRGWLTSDRSMVLERHLATLDARPRSDEPDPGRALVHVATAIYALLLPLGAAQRIATALVAAFVGALFVIVDALAED